METKKLPPLRKKVPLKVEPTVTEVLPVTPRSELPPLHKKVPLKVETTVKEIHLVTPRSNLPPLPSKKSILPSIKSEILIPKIELSKFSKEALFSIAIHLDVPEILKLCETNKKIDEKLCKQRSEERRVGKECRL